MIKLMAAVSEDFVIGLDGRMPWHYKGDMRRFREQTTGTTVVMGRKTYDSIGKPLPNRCNVVVTRTPRPPLADLPAGTTVEFVDATEARNIVRAVVYRCTVCNGDGSRCVLTCASDTSPCPVAGCIGTLFANVVHIIGGAEIYALFMPLADVIEVVAVPGTAATPEMKVSGRLTYFPTVEPADWQLDRSEPHPYAPALVVKTFVRVDE